MKHLRFIPLIAIVILAVISSFAVQAESDGRINLAHHFGGDALYCEHDSGCSMLNMNGELLWEVPQSTIDAVMEVACETGMSQYIEAGQGTYGSAVLRISCYDGYEPGLTLGAFDEHGKYNEMSFSTSYEQVAPAVEVEAETDTTPIPVITPEPTPITCPPGYFLVGDMCLLPI